jgi:hypothetical protein
MNASMARRIRNAEAALISAIDRHMDGRRRPTGLHETGRSGQNSPRLLVPVQDEHGIARSNLPAAGLCRPSCLA